jgi:hypothetical protein
MLRKLAIRALTRLSWGTSSKRLAAGMDRFAQVEADSAWQLLQAIEATPSVSLQARFFGNVLEEVEHAALFSRLARAHASAAPPLAAPPRRQIFDPAKGLAAFSAYLYVSEGEVYEQFFSYATAARDDGVRRTFLAIRGDEGDHEAHAWRELVELAQSEKRARKLARRARLSRIYDAWLRFGKRLGALPAFVLLSVIYFVAAPLLTWACRRLIRRITWTTVHDVAAAGSPLLATAGRERAAS